MTVPFYYYEEENDNDSENDKSSTSKIDYYFITNIDFPPKSDWEKIKGCHRIGAQGGFQTKFHGEGDDNINETMEETFAHEMGHWLGLYHCFGSGSHRLKGKGYSISYQKGKSGEGNFMDYNVIRKSWFKSQLLFFLGRRF